MNRLFVSLFSSSLSERLWGKILIPDFSKEGYIFWFEQTEIMKPKG